MYDPSKLKLERCAFFMGLQRKQGVPIQEGQQFDIRLTVDEFKQSVGRYIYWKPGMDIYVSHVRRKQIPLYVFPGGVRRTRSSRVPNQTGKTSPGGVECSPKNSNGNCGDDTVEECNSAEKANKRKYECAVDVGKAEKRAAVSPNDGKCVYSLVSDVANKPKLLSQACSGEEADSLNSNVGGGTVLQHVDIVEGSSEGCLKSDNQVQDKSYNQKERTEEICSGTELSNDCVSRPGKFKNALEELEPSVNLGVVPTTQNGLKPETVQKPVL
ncbi:hypothetical protein KI387_012711, partial [Taxus chinensis]